MRNAILYSLTLLAVAIQYGAARMEPHIDRGVLVVGGSLFILVMAAAFDSWLPVCVVISGAIGLLLSLPFFPPLISSGPRLGNPYLEYLVRGSVTMVAAVVGLALERRRR